jgi:hypothetical protein
MWWICTLAGLLVLSQIAGSTTEAVSGLRAEPKEITIVATRTSGPFADALDARAHRVWIREAKGRLNERTLAGSESGELVEVQLRRSGSQPRGLPANVIAAEAAVATEAVPGTYKGEFALDEKRSLAIVVKVRDHIVWPILFVFVGALVGALATWFFDRYRRRQHLLSEVKRLVETYQAATSAQDELLTARFGAEPPRPHRLEWPAVPELERYKCRPEDASAQITDAPRQLLRLWCQLERAGSDDLERLAPLVDELDAALAVWLEIASELRALLIAVALVPDDSGIWSDSRGIVADAAVDAVDDDERAARIARIRRQVNVIAAYKVVDDLFRETSDRGTHINTLDPAAIYRAAGPERERSEASTQELLTRFAAARDRLLRIGPGPRRADERQVFALAGRAFVPVLASNLSQAAAALAPRQLAAPQRALSSREMLRSLRRWTLLASILSAVVATAAYVLPFYAGDDFGSLADYAGALLAGGLGQVGAFALNDRTVG